MFTEFDPSRVQAILFDVDGTLADTDDEYIRRAGIFIRRLHFLFPRRDPTNFLRWSLMIAETPLNLMAGVPDWLGIDDELARLFEWLADRRGPETSAHFVLIDGVREMLDRLAGRWPLGLVTARGERATQAFLEQFGLVPYFRAVASAQTAPYGKPYPDPVLWAAQALGVPAESCLMVGDTTIDILAGRRAGAQTVGVLCGFGEETELARSGAGLILARTPQLAGVLLDAAPWAAANPP